MPGTGLPKRINLRVTRGDGVPVTVVVRVNAVAGPEGPLPDEQADRVPEESEGYPPITRRVVESRTTLDNYLASVTEQLQREDSALVDALTPDARRMLQVLDVHGDPPNPIPVRLEHHG